MKIAVILTSYNHAKYIVEALDGIRTQYRMPDEVVVADDASTDNTQEIIKDYFNKYNLNSKWTLLLNAKNKGINGNFQNALENTTSEVVIGMAGDDISFPNRCEVTEKLFNENQDVSIIVTSGVKIDPLGNYLGNVSEVNGMVYSNVMDAIKLGYPGVRPVGQAIKREVFNFFGPLPCDVPNEDDQLSFRGLILGGILASSIVTYSYRIHSSSASSWLRDYGHKKSGEFVDLLIENMELRRRHFCHWLEIIKKTNRLDKEILISRINKKIYLYEILSEAKKIAFTKKILFATANYQILSYREFFYLLGGRSGIFLWRQLKMIFKKNGQ